MAAKIRRCLYVGLGGTGMTALLNTKKTFLETYGEIPPMIGFLGIDTDGGQYKKELDSKYGKVILTPNEQLPVIVNDARPIYEVNKSHFSWLPDENLYALTSMRLGAGAVRTNGRFALTVNYRDVENKINTVLNSISQATITNSPKYDLLASETEIHVVFSVCGGTGSGTFINMAYLLRKCAPTSKITGYGVLPDVFEAMAHSGMAKVKPNAYGAVQDLDWLMHLGLKDDKVAFDYITSTYDTNEKPFNAFFFVDNKNSNNDTYLHVDQLAEMISLALVTSAGELSNAAASVSDNLEKNIREGTMDIENKKAWVAGLGVCEIMYRGEDLRELYARIAAKRVIDDLLNNCADIDKIVNAWIDSQEVRIRENEGSDDVIDFILPKQPSYQLTSIEDKANPKLEVDSYINSSKPKDADLKKKVEELESRVTKEFIKLIKKEINNNCGVGVCEGIIAGIDRLVDVFLAEMHEEVDELNNDLSRRTASLDVAIRELKECNGKFWKNKATLEEHANTVCNMAMQIVVCERDIARHNSAIKFFNALKVSLREMMLRVGNINSVLKAVYSDLSNDVTSIQNYVGKESQTFQIDLAKTEMLQLKVNTDEILMSDLIRSLKSEDKIYDFSNKTKNEVVELLLNYTRQLRTAKNLGNRSIDEMLNKMSEDDFGKLIRTSINKSNTLLRFDYKGYTPQERPAHRYYIGVPDKKESRLCKDDSFKNQLAGDVDVDFASIGVKDRVIVYRQDGVYPVYCISSLSSCKEKYEHSNCFSHIDANIYRRMQREDYSILPKVAADDSIELWVKGFIFNLIKNEGGVYYLQSEELGDVLDDNWVELAQYRDTAFENFKRNKNIVRKEFNAFFDNFQKTKGVEKMQELVDSAKREYLPVFSQINMTKEEIRQRGNEEIKKLITEELEYVKKEL